MNAPAANPAKDRAVAFSKPEQIREILGEADRLKLPILIKYSLDGKAVRGFVDVFEFNEHSLLIAGISQQGDQLLKGFDVVKIEFILFSKKLVFVSPIRARAPGKIVVGLPDKLVAIERRTNQRFRVPPGMAAFVEFNEKKVDLSRFDAPFVPNFLRESRTATPHLRVDDVSLGGVACFTRFNAVSEQLRADEESLPAIIQFPAMAPISVAVTVRWSKKTISAVPPGRLDRFSQLMAARLKSYTGNDPLQMRETFYRVGLQFAEVSGELDAALRTFVRVVQASESV